MAPAVGFEPTTRRLTVVRSTTELRWISFGRGGTYIHRSGGWGNYFLPTKDSCRQAMRDAAFSRRMRAGLPAGRFSGHGAREVVAGGLTALLEGRNFHQ